MARRITSSSINWNYLSEMIPEHQRAVLNSFRGKCTIYLRNCLQLPLDPPKIDWEYYRTKVLVPGMVDNFKKEYESLKIPYPSENVSHVVDVYEKEVKEYIDNFIKESNLRIKSYQQQLDYISSLLPYDEMTMDDYKDAFPEDALDTFKKPTFWPHNPEEQLGYVKPTSDEAAAEELEKAKHTTMPKPAPKKGDKGKQK